MDELEGLARRVEAATGADRLLDYLIRAAIGKGVRLNGAVRVSPASESGYETVHYANGGVSQGSMPPAYTASLDAALTLVPEGWTFANLSQGDNRRWWCELRRGHLTSYDKVAIGQQLNPLTPALALCAAALRARAHERTAHG